MKISRLAVIAGLLVLASCSDGTGPKDITGTYDLQSINGKLPFTVYETSAIRQEVTSGTLSLRDDRTFVERMNATSFSKASGTISGQDQFVQQGVYTRTGNTVTLDPDESATLTATVSGDRLTYVTPNNLTAVFEK